VNFDWIPNTADRLAQSRESAPRRFGPSHGEWNTLFRDKDAGADEVVFQLS